MEHATTPGSVNGKREANVLDFRPDGLLLRDLSSVANDSILDSPVRLSLTIFNSSGSLIAKSVQKFL